MDKLVTDKPKDNFSVILNYVFSRDGQAYIRTDEDGNGVLLTEWMKSQCIAHGCTELEDVNVDDIDELISDCAFAFYSWPLFVLYTCACQAVHLRDRLRLYENTGTFPSDIERLKEAAKRRPLAGPYGKMRCLNCGCTLDLMDLEMGSSEKETAKN